MVRDEGATETIYIGGIYEEAGSNSKSYCTFAGSVVAFREQDTGVDERYYLVSDHLGTNSHQIKYSDGTRTSQYYLPFGGDRGGTAGNFQSYNRMLWMTGIGEEGRRTLPNLIHGIRRS